MVKIKSQKYYNKIISIKEKIKGEFPTIFISIFLFLTLWYFFGIYNIILPPFMTLFFKIKHSLDFRAKELIKNYIILTVVGLGAFLATQSLILCISLNLILPFFIVYLLTNKFTPKAYFVYCMSFVFLQLVPISLAELPMRIGAMFYTYGVVTIALHLHYKWVKRKKYYDSMRDKFINLSIQLEKLVKGENFLNEKIELMKSIPAMNQLIYSTRNYKYLTTEYGKNIYWFMMVIQRFLYFIENYTGADKKLTLGDKIYFEKLSKLFKEIGKEFTIDGNSKLILKISKFLGENRLEDITENERIKSILNLLKLPLSNMKAKDYNKREKSWKLPEKKTLMSLDLFQIRFALRLSIVLSLTFTISYITKLEHSYWLPMSAFLMLMPYAEESRTKITNRVLGTLGGILICWILMSLSSVLYYKIVIIIFMTIMMYTAPITSWTMTMYTTCYGMVLATLTLGLGDAILFRLLYVGGAVFITSLANHYILPNTVKREFKKNIEELFESSRKILLEVKKSYKNLSSLNNFISLLLEYNLLVNEVKTYIGQNMKEREREFYLQMLGIMNTLIVEMEQLNSYFYNKRHLNILKDNIVLEEIFKNLEDAIKRIHMSYTKNELISFMNTYDKREIFGKLGEELYFNSLIFNCMESVKRLEELHISKKCIGTE